MEKTETEKLIEVLDRIAVKYRDKLVKIEDEAERELVRIMASAEGSVIDRVRDKLVAEKIEIDTATSLSSDIEKILDETLTVGGQTWINSNAPMAFENGVDFVRDSWLIGSGLLADVASVRMIDDHAIRSAFLNFTETDSIMLRSGIQRGYTLIKDISAELTDHLKETFVRHVALGSSTRDVVKDIISGGKLEPIGRFTLEQRAAMIARTELARIDEDAGLVKSSEVGIQYFRWSALMDSRTAKDSLIRHGRIKTIAEWRVYNPDKLKGTPPLRPHDRCRLIPMNHKWIKDDQGRKDFDRVVKEDKRFLFSERERKIIKETEGVTNDFL